MRSWPNSVRSPGCCRRIYGSWNGNVATTMIEPLVQEIQAGCTSSKLRDWLDELQQQHLIDNLDRFRERSDKEQGPDGADDDAGDDRDRFLEYQVNLLVDNSQQQGAPVVIEDAPTYRNLFGAIERSGRPSTAGSSPTSHASRRAVC